MTNDRLLVYSMWYVSIQYAILNMRSLQASSSSDIVFVLYFICLMTPNDLWSRLKAICFLYSMWYSNIHNMTTVQACLLDISYLQGFHSLTPNDPNDPKCWPQMTFWPPPKTIGFLYLMWYTYIPNMRSVRASLLEISCLQAGVTTHTHTHTHAYTHTHTHTHTQIHTHTRQHDCKGYDYHRG